MELFKLHVENLGRIKQAELSIRPLTVFVGPNNTNKTWTAYAGWFLAKWLSRSPASGVLPMDIRHRLWFDPDDQFKQVVHQAVAGLRATFQEAQDGGTVSQDLKRANLLSQIDYPLRVALTPSGIATVLGGSPTLPANARVTLEMSQSQFLPGLFRSSSFEYARGQRDRCTATLIDSHGEASRPKTQVLDTADDGALERFLAETIYTLLCARFDSVDLFPTERSTLVTPYGLRDEPPWGALSSPAIVFHNRLHEIILDSVLLTLPSPLSDVGVLMERQPLGGTVSLEPQGPAASLRFIDSLGNAMPIHTASSLVRALAGLDVYLKHWAIPGDLIVIDEPEMNAHPEAQLMIAELLGILVNKGINVVITTHSPYIVDHINNLVEAAHLCEEKQKEIAGRFKLKTKDAFVPEENVATYEFHDDGQVTNIFDRGERLIHWDTFGKVSDEVGNLYSDLLEIAAKE